MKWQDALNIAGSVASISGVSLLWMRSFVPVEIHTPGLIAASLVTLGLVAVAIYSLTGHRSPYARTRKDVVNQCLRHFSG